MCWHNPPLPLFHTSAVRSLLCACILASAQKKTAEIYRARTLVDPAVTLAANEPCLLAHMAGNQWVKTILLAFSF